MRFPLSVIVLHIKMVKQMEMSSGRRALGCASHLAMVQTRFTMTQTLSFAQKHVYAYIYICIYPMYAYIYTYICIHIYIL